MTASAAPSTTDQRRAMTASTLFKSASAAPSTTEGQEMPKSPFVLDSIEL